MKLRIWKTFLDRQSLLTFDADPVAKLLHSLRQCNLISLLVDNNTGMRTRTSSTQ
jgi:hypothetical protein